MSCVLGNPCVAGKPRMAGYLPPTPCRRWLSVISSSWWGKVSGLSKVTQPGGSRAETQTQVSGHSWGLPPCHDARFPLHCHLKRGLGAVISSGFPWASLRVGGFSRRSCPPPLPPWLSGCRCDQLSEAGSLAWWLHRQHRETEHPSQGHTARSGQVGKTQVSLMLPDGRRAHPPGHSPQASDSTNM